MRRVGGTQVRASDGFTIQGGTAGVSNAMSADISAIVTIRQREQNTFEVNCAITAKPNAIFWVCGIAGFFCLMPLWIVNLFYFMMDPLPPYQRALDQIELPSGS